VDISNIIGLGLQREVSLAWKSFYAGTGHHTEAQVAAQRVAKNEQSFHDHESKSRWIYEYDTRYRREAWIVQISLILLVIAAIAAILGIGLIEVQPAIWSRYRLTRRVLCFITDFTPAIVLTACIVFLLSFLPYARLLTAFRSGGPGAPDEQQLSTAFWSLLIVAQTVLGPGTAVTGWTVLTVVLYTLLALILARMVYRAMRAPASQV
jgi:hypothetical protein